MPGDEVVEEGRHASEVAKWPRGTYWISHLALYVGTGPDRELLEIGPVYWKGGKLGAYLSYRNLTPKKLRGRGQTHEDPIFLEARYSTILDVLAQRFSALVKTKAKIMPVDREKDATELKQLPAASPSTETVFADGEVEEEAEQHVARIHIRSCLKSTVMWQDVPK
ncbi:g11381 [Coccomyxa viridis]|uniref:G11381 protein n=1 Tax=Coccomyxa viridis TaxID=1274662 RepID=A0ABP1G8Z9_9CHLO